MSEIEDMAGPPPGGTQDLFHAQLQNLKGSKQGDGVQVTLHGVAVTDGAPAFVERLTPVETDDIGAG